MTVDTTWEFRDNLEPRRLSEAPMTNLDADFVNAALLFLDNDDAVTDSDSKSSVTVEMTSTVAIDTGSRGEEPSSAQVIATESRLTDSAPKQPTAPRRVNKRREEIHELRAQTKKLQTRVRMLKAKPSVPLSNTPGLFMIAPLGSTWEDVASQQFAQRERAEKENRRLKALLDEHKRIATAFQQVAALGTAFPTEKTLLPESRRPQIPPDAELSLQVPNILDVLVGSLGLMVEQTNLVISDSLGRIVNTERHGNSHLTVQIQDARIVPAGVATTVSVMWEHALLQEDFKQLHWTMLSDDTFQSEFVTFTEFPGFRGHALGKLVVRRVEQANRTVIVRSAIFQCQCGHMKNRFLTLPMRHFLWTVIDRPPHLGVIPGQDTISRVRTTAISLPRIDVGDLSDPARDLEIEDLRQLNIAISTQQCDQAIDSVDKRLLGRGAQFRSEDWPSQANLSWNLVQNAC